MYVVQGRNWSAIFQNSWFLFYKNSHVILLFQQISLRGVPSWFSYSVFRKNDGDLPRRNQCSQWCQKACRPELMDTNCQMESTRGNVGVASGWPVENTKYRNNEILNYGFCSVKHAFSMNKLEFSIWCEINLVID